MRIVMKENMFYHRCIPDDLLTITDYMKTPWGMSAPTACDDRLIVQMSRVCIVSIT